MADKKKEPVVLNVEGMTCTNCAMGISRHLENKGLEGVRVDFATHEVTFEPGDKDLQEVIDSINSLGYQVVEEAAGEEAPGLLGIEKKFLFCLVFTVPLFLSMFLPFEFLKNQWVQLVLCIPVYAVGIYHFGRSAWSSLKTGVPNMDVLITMGSSAAFIYSLAGTLLSLGHEYMFYETAATIITLVLLGNVMEGRSVRRTTTALKSLGRLQVKQARVIEGEGVAETIVDKPIERVFIGELLQVNEGESIPLDGEVMQGDAYVDESMLTGESSPVLRSKGSNVIGGTLVSEGNIRVKVRATGNKTVLANIIRMVKEAQSNKPAIQKLGDKVSAYFVPIVASIAILTFLIAHFGFGISIQQSLLQGIAVLVIACPCAMGLATPTAVMVGLGRAASQGILIKGGNTIEQFAGIRQIVFDKTGTLTNGRFRIKELKVLEGDEEDIRTLIYNLEKHSSHPIAKSVMLEIGPRQILPLSDVKEKKGLGISATGPVGEQYALGSARISGGLKEEFEGHDIYLFKNGQPIAWLDLIDELRPGAAQVIAYLKENGIKSILLSGDRESKCRDIAAQLKIEEYYAEKMPHEKQEIVSRLSELNPTAMVGDGINDAPALARATVGISLSDSTEIARDASQVILLNGNISHLPGAYGTAKHTMKTIRQNLFWAFFYNIMAIPVAAVGLLNPMIAALTMAFSDVMVIGNSLRLKIKKIT